MFKKLIESWKNEWLLKKNQELSVEYASRLESSIKILQDKIKEETDKQNSILRSIEFKNQELKLQEERLHKRELELIAAQDNLKKQIELLEAKASPTSVWADAFGKGMEKSWDLLLPVMLDNIEKLKSKIREDAAIEAIKRMNHATNKK